MNKWKRALYGNAHYTTSDIQIAETYAKEVKIDSRYVKFVIQSRVNPKNLTEAVTDHGKYWLLTNDHDLRPYGLCFKYVLGVVICVKSLKNLYYRKPVKTRGY